MSIIDRILRQSAVYWEVQSGADAFGNAVLSSPVEINCRWDEVSEMFTDAEGQQLVSKAKVYVDRDVVLGSFLKLGYINSTLDESNPEGNENVWPVRAFKKIGDMKANKFVRVAFLA